MDLKLRCDGWSAGVMTRAGECVECVVGGLPETKQFPPASPPGLVVRTCHHKCQARTVGLSHCPWGVPAGQRVPGCGQSNIGTSND